MSGESERAIQQPDFGGMSASDWRDYLRNHPDWCLVINDPNGVHTIQYEDHEDEVMFFAHGSQGYDRDGTQAVLDTIEGDSDGLRVQTREETYG